MSKKYEFSDDILRGILYLSKADREFFVQTTHMIEPEYFDTNVQSATYQVIKEYFDKYRTLPSDALIIEGLKEKNLDEVESELVAELHRINAIQKESVKHKEAYLDMTEKFAKERAMKEAIISGISLMEEGRVEEIENEVKKALKVGRHSDLGLSYRNDYEGRYERFYGMQAVEDRFGMGFPGLDGPLHGGLARKEMGMIVANSGVGKSLFLCRQGLYSAMRNLNVLYISLEMSEDSIMARLDTMLTKMDYKTIRDNHDIFIERVKKASPLVRGEYLVKQFPSLLTTPSKVRAYLEYCQNILDKKFDVLIVDYLELMRPSVKDLPEYEAQQRIAQELRGIAVEYNLVVWSATQANRQGASARNITETELAGSFGKIREVDFSFSINQDDDERKNGQARLYVMKSRNARSRYVVNVDIDYRTLQINEVEDEDGTELD